MSDPMIGQIMAFAGNYIPKDWAPCKGTLVPITQYTPLYAIMGTTYGGDGRSTMGLPDLQGRSPLGMGQGAGLMTRIIGDKGGIEQVSLVTSQMPCHTHTAAAAIEGDVTATVNCCSGTSDIQSSPTNNVMASQGRTVSSDSKVYSSAAPDSTMSSSSISTENNLSVNVSIDTKGEGNDHENMHPWLCLNYIISLQGYFPPRP